MPIRLSNRLKTFLNSTLGRCLLFAFIVAVALTANATVAHLKHNKYADARRAADTFLTAYTSCDVATARKYYPDFQTDSAAVAKYKSQCHKGDISFSYESQGSYSEKTNKAVHSINLTLYYNASQSGGKSARFIVAMMWDSTHKQWTISSISAAPTSSTTPRSATT